MCARIWEDRTERVYRSYVTSLYSKTRSPSFCLGLVVCLYALMKSYQLRCIDKSWYFLIKYSTLSSALRCVRVLMKSYQLLCNTSKFFSLFFYFIFSLNKRKISCHFHKQHIVINLVNQSNLFDFFFPSFNLSEYCKTYKFTKITLNLPKLSVSYPIPNNHSLMNVF